MNGNIRIGSLFGIPFYLNPSWFLVLGLVTWTYGGGLAADFPDLAPVITGLLGLVTALLLFASVLAHELGHSWVALRQGINVQSITLFLFGGVASLDKESTTPGGTFWVAIAGPLVSVCLSVLFHLINFASGATGPVGAVLQLLGSINLALAVFNLIPGLPLDGGNILKAIVWQVTGNPDRGIIIASRMGQLLGWAAILSCLLPLLLTGQFTNVWNLLIGSFVVQNAGRSVQMARVRARCAGLTAADAVTPNGPVIQADLSLREFADQRIISNDAWRKFLVVDEAGNLIGEMVVDALPTVPRDRWSETPVQALVQPLSSPTLAADLPLWDVMQQLEEKNLTALPVMHHNGNVLGLLEKSTIIRLLQRSPAATAA
jgi:Zn-dependent protease/CBS domain-containing protein